MVDLKLENLVKNIQQENSECFIKASDEDINKLKKLLCKYDLEKVIDFYRLYQPAHMPSIEEGVLLLNIDGIFMENFRGEPGKLLSKFGVFTFATTIGGNLICFDANDVVDGEPSVLYAEHDFCFYSYKFNKVEISGKIPARVVKEKGLDLVLNYENIKDCLFRFEERFSEFLIKALKGEYLLQGNCEDIEDYVEDNRGEYV